jgi:hypothetical protein
MTVEILTQQAARAERLARCMLDQMTFDGLMALAREYRAKAEALSAEPVDVVLSPTIQPSQPTA